MNPLTKKLISAVIIAVVTKKLAEWQNDAKEKEQEPEPKRSRFSRR